ncbi:MAG: class I SAM-dependent methyltransferase [Planctomycetes bacterium]|nr:class I SAM-dependent methyltransferase [Planctomycetota bacterium]
MQTKKPWRLGTRAQLLLRGLRYSRILPYTSIDGWLTVDEAITLYELARALPHERPLVVEIGCWQGKSSVCLARGLQPKNHGRLCCIDPFDATGDTASQDLYADRARSVGSLREVFEQNLRDAGVHDLVDVRQGLSQDLARDWREPIDLLFLDGDHSDEAARRDFDDWSKHVRPGGFVVLHDAVHPVHTGPRRVVEQRITPDPSWVDRRQVDSMFVARKACQ